MTRAVQIAELGDQNVFTIDGDNNRVGIGSTQPTVKLDVDGVVVATAFTGDGSGLTGVASTDNIITGTAATFTNVVKVGTAITLDATSGIITAVNGFVGPLTGAVTGNVTGTASLASNLTGTPDITVRNITGVAATFTGVLTYEDVTNVDSVGIITARSGVSIADSIFHTGDTNTSIRFPAADTFTVETAGTERFRVLADGTVSSGTLASTPGTIAAGSLVLTNTNAGFFSNNGGDAKFGSAASNNVLLQTNGVEKIRLTTTGGVHFNNAELIERVNIVANKLSAVPNVNLDNGMVHYYTTNETTTANPNIITTAGINTNMATGDTMSVTILSKPNNAGYFPRISIDGRLAGITTYWSGGSAPSSAESSGVDVNTYQIIKTGSETFDVLANTSNFA